jgi:hypothetical protein
LLMYLYAFQRTVASALAVIYRGMLDCQHLVGQFL